LRESQWSFCFGDDCLYDEKGNEIGRFEWGVEDVLESHVDLGVPDQAGGPVVANDRNDQPFPQYPVIEKHTTSIIELVQRVRKWVVDDSDPRNSPMFETRWFIRRLRRVDPNYQKRTRIERAAMHEAVEQTCWAVYKAVEQQKMSGTPH